MYTTFICTCQSVYKPGHLKIVAGCGTQGAQDAFFGKLYGSTGLIPLVEKPLN